MDILTHTMMGVLLGSVLPNGALECLPEYRLMRALSPVYCVVEESSGRLTCRDLRTRNFSTRFGQLDVRIGQDGLMVEKWHV